MKKVLLIAAFIIFTGLNGLVAQTYPINPIPSYNVALTNPTTGFKEMTHVVPGREKREMDVVISSSSTSPIPVYAKVWVAKVDGSKMFGPYYIFLDHTLSVPIDHGQWGVIIKCDWAVDASVWIN